MNVLIIGGTRFLGLEITRRLAERGDEVTVVNRGRTECALPESVERLTADIDEERSLVNALDGRTFDACVHMIAMNGARAQRVIDAVFGLVDRYVQCGSTGVFMPLRHVPADETEPVDPPPNEWGGFNAKAESDEVARDLCERYELPLTILRPTAIIGPGDVPLDIWGSRDPRLFQSMLDGEPVRVPERGRGLIQFGDVRDLAAAFVLALDQPEKAGEYNISSPYAITHNYYVELLSEAMGVVPAVEHVPAEELVEEYGDTDRLNVRGLRFFVEHMCFTIDKACTELGYDPQHTAEDSVAASVKWMFDNGIIARGSGCG
ncbi:MAG: NAD-dependent epimerase/dehydratase family protein [Armatimonadota bacterium]|nr:NAD-dependent epimerase/dehydratase family protein [Armatimonadota bacterium]